MQDRLKADYHAAFKQADIRGVYPKEIDDEVVYFVARAFVDEYQFKKVIVARDMRLSSPALHRAFLQGATDAGADVIDMGMVHTPALYFASATLNLPGVVITASHSPKNHNGLKLVLPQAIPLTEEHGLKAIRRRLDKGVYQEPVKKGKVTVKNLLPAYQKFVLRGIKSTGLSQLSLVADVGNGMGAVLLPLLTAKLPLSLETLFPELDGNFPNRGSDPTLKKNHQDLAQALKTGKYDFGFGLDGDSDRIAFLDETGKFVNCAAIGALIATYILEQKPGERFVYTNLTSRVYEETIKAKGGVAVPARVGHAFIKETMRQRDAVFGCEHSGHFYFKDYFYTDSVTLTLRYVLLSYLKAKKQGLTFSKMLAPYTKYQQSQDVIVPVADRPRALKLTEDFLRTKKPLKVKRFDGVWFDFGEVWGTVKVSVTEPALKIMFEGYKAAAANKLQAEVVAFVKRLEAR